MDAGYTNGPGFLAPYRGTRYHLNEWTGNNPETYKELFNLRHSVARNVIERAFGLLKSGGVYCAYHLFSTSKHKLGLSMHVVCFIILFESSDLLTLS